MRYNSEEMSEKYISVNSNDLSIADTNDYIPNPTDTSDNSEVE